MFGKEERSAPSRFLSDLPKELVEWKTSYSASYGNYSGREYDRDMRERTALPQKNTRVENWSRYKVGQRIEHPSFGQGTIKRVEGTGDDAKVTISFQRHGIKKIIASYLEG